MSDDLKNRIIYAMDALTPPVKAADLARKIKVEPPSVADWRSGKKKPARYRFPDLAEALGVDLNWLEYGQGDTPVSRRVSSSAPPEDDGFVANPVPIPAPSQTPNNLPVYGSAQGGSDGAFEMNGAIIDYAPMPPTLAGVRNPYGVYVSGDSMLERYEPGWLLHVHPHKQPRPGDNVVVQIRPRDEHSAPLAYVKVLVSDHHKSGGKLVVRQFNPPKELSWDGKDVVSVHLIVGVSY